KSSPGLAAHDGRAGRNDPRRRRLRSVVGRSWLATTPPQGAGTVYTSGDLGRTWSRVSPERLVLRRRRIGRRRRGRPRRHESADHALALVERADELQRAALRERDVDLGLVARLDLLVDALLGDRERMGRVALVLELQLDLLTGLALEDRWIEVVVVE